MAHSVGQAAADAGAPPTPESRPAGPTGEADGGGELEDAAAQELAALATGEDLQDAGLDSEALADDSEGALLQALARTASRRDKPAEPS
jgi:hypothetical protein